MALRLGFYPRLMGGNPQDGVLWSTFLCGIYYGRRKHDGYAVGRKVKRLENRAKRQKGLHTGTRACRLGLFLRGGDGVFLRMTSAKQQTDTP